MVEARCRRKCYHPLSSAGIHWQESREVLVSEIGFSTRTRAHLPFPGTPPNWWSLKGIRKHNHIFRNPRKIAVSAVGVKAAGQPINQEEKAVMSSTGPADRASEPAKHAKQTLAFIDS